MEKIWSCGCLSYFYFRFLSMKIFGFSVLSNALKENTCFRESVGSLNSITDDTHVFVLKSVDGTESVLRDIDGFQLHSFEEGKRDGILQILRENCENIPDSWALFLEPDEVLDIRDEVLLKEDIRRAMELGCEAICFRNLNFVQTPHRIAIGEDVPAHSIRLFRLGSNHYFDRGEVSFDERVYYSEVKLFNYSNLRKEKEGLDIEVKDETLEYLGEHPVLMKRRVENWGGVWDRLEVAKVYILGEPREYRPEFIEKIKAKKIIWAGNIVEIPAEDRPKAVILKPTLFQKVFRGSQVPKKMKSSEAHEWNSEFILTLKLSEKGVGIG